MNLRTLFLLILSPFIMAPSCGNDFPGWDAKFYAGDSEKGAIVRSQSEEIIQCDDPRFNDFVAVRYEDLRELREDIIPRCKEWESREEFKRRINRGRR